MYGEPKDGPAREYDLYCARKEELYRQQVHTMTCEDCCNCVKPDERYWNNAERIGYCTDVGDFVGLDDSVEDMGCESFG